MLLFLNMGCCIFQRIPKTRQTAYVRHKTRFNLICADFLTCTVLRKSRYSTVRPYDSTILSSCSKNPQHAIIALNSSLSIFSEFISLVPQR